MNNTTTTAQASLNSDNGSMALHFMRKNMAWQIISPKEADKIDAKAEEKGEEYRTLRLEASNITPESLLKGLFKNDASALIHRRTLFTKGCKLHDDAIAKGQDLSVAKVLNWLEEGGSLIMRRSALGYKPWQLQTPDARRKEAANKKMAATGLSTDMFASK